VFKLMSTLDDVYTLHLESPNIGILCLLRYQTACSQLRLYWRREVMKVCRYARTPFLFSVGKKDIAQRQRFHLPVCERLAPGQRTGEVNEGVVMPGFRCPLL